MTLDGFLPSDKNAPRFDAMARIDEGRLAFVSRVAQRIGVDVRGIENIPAGRALLVANHSFGWDIVFVMSAVHARTGRTVWALGEHAWWKVPFVRRVAASLGTVDGTQENADRILSQDGLLLVMPGGVREALKPRELRYRLLWGQRYGFVRAALRNRAPIVPVASLGGDEVFDLVGNAFKRGNRWLRGTGIPIPLTSRVLPIPRFVPLRFVIGEPVPPPAATNEPEEVVVKRVRREVEGSLHELFEHELASRAGMRDV